MKNRASKYKKSSEQIIKNRASKLWKIERVNRKYSILKFS